MKPQLNLLEEAKILVVGDVILDRYWMGDSKRISPEAPVPVVNGEKVLNRLGGAGNVAANVASLGCSVSLLGYVGQDEDGDLVRQLLKESQIESDLITREDLNTTVKIRVISQGQQLVRVDFEDSSNKFKGDHLTEAFQEIVDDYQLVIFSDYLKGTLHNVSQLIALANERQKKVITDPKGSDFSRYKGTYLITPNMTEFEAVVGVCSDDQAISRKAKKLAKDHQIENILVTRGSLGMSLYPRSGPELHVPADAEDVFDVTGAGDTVCGVVGAMLAAGQPIAKAVSIANRAAGLAVKRLGAAVISAKELEAMLIGKDRQRKLISMESLQEKSRCVRAGGGKVVFTNGCFDILHVGHVMYLEEARKLGNMLIVGINSDESVKDIKGVDRPINTLKDRVRVLEALESVDSIIVFDEATPINLIKALLPDILVKGGDYKLEEIIGYSEVLSHGGEVKALKFFASKSTSSLAKQIESL